MIGKIMLHDISSFINRGEIKMKEKTKIED